MTCRTLACLPALTGAYADPHGGALLSSGGAFELDFAAFERPDLMPRPSRVINMIQLGRALTDPTLAPPTTVAKGGFRAPPTPVWRSTHSSRVRFQEPPKSSAPAANTAR